MRSENRIKNRNFGGVFLIYHHLIMSHLRISFSLLMLLCSLVCKGHEVMSATSLPPSRCEHHADRDTLQTDTATILTEEYLLRKASQQDTLVAHATKNGGSKVISHIKAVGGTIGINASILTVDRFILRREFARISPRHFWDNLRSRWVWDNDKFMTNLFAHPYHGQLYFNSARTQGLSFWESTPHALLGSIMWETACETEPPSINDLISTTVGGIAMGEALHRLGECVLREDVLGGKRVWHEMLYCGLNPIGGLHRLITGRSWRICQVSDNEQRETPKLKVGLTSGLQVMDVLPYGRYRSYDPFVSVIARYGDAFDLDQNRPFDYFELQGKWVIGKGQQLTDRFKIKARYLGFNLSDRGHERLMGGIFQHFDYHNVQAMSGDVVQEACRITETASWGIGLMYERQIRKREQTLLKAELHVSGILMGGCYTDHFRAAERDYNIGPGWSLHQALTWSPTAWCSLGMDTSHHMIASNKGYEGKNTANASPLYLDTQGDRGQAHVTRWHPWLEIKLGRHWSANMGEEVYVRHMKYKNKPQKRAKIIRSEIGITFTP